MDDGVARNVGQGLSCNAVAKHLECNAWMEYVEQASEERHVDHIEHPPCAIDEDPSTTERQATCRQQDRATADAEEGHPKPSEQGTDHSAPPLMSEMGDC